MKNLFSVSPLVDSKNTINVYIVDFENTYSGLSTSPNLSNGIDVIVIDKKYFGVHSENIEGYNQGKTLVHLMASFFGIFELWNENNPCIDDKVADTPTHNYANFSPGSVYKNISTCEGNEVEMIVNYMDNLPDEYCLIFTRGQVDRMKKVCLSQYGRRDFNFLECGQIDNRLKSSLNLVLFPNPNTGDFSLSSSESFEKIVIKIYDIWGVEIFDKEYKRLEKGDKVDIVIENNPSGMYALRIFTEDKLLKQINFIKY
jgi:hypothetical protein